MLFNSPIFLLFLPIVFVLYWFVFYKNLKIQNLFLLITSYVFYGWWDWRFLFLIALTSFFSFYSGILINRWRNTVKSRWVSIFNIVLNLSILGLFKYFNFFAENLKYLFHAWGVELDWFTLDILLPVGISFYTFQALSYSIDVYKNKIKPTTDIVPFFAFISFFPQLVAGPIERATNLLPQFFSKRIFSYHNAIDGLKEILWGFFKKMVVADNCSPIVNSIFNNVDDCNGSTLLIGAVLFTFQIYGDFSGYSNIARGTAKLLGFELMINFKYPYFSRNVAEFWRRWHISLTTWFRDYIYIPLGGSRVSKLKVIRNTFIIFLVSGFWHGANWTFVLWGLYHAVLFLPFLLLGKNRANGAADIGGGGFVIKECSRMLMTFFLVTIGWIIFRSASVDALWIYLKMMFSPSLFAIPNNLPIIKFAQSVLGIFLLLVIEWKYRNCDYGFQIDFKYRFWRWSFYLFFMILCFLSYKEEQDFIYFQF